MENCILHLIDKNYNMWGGGNIGKPIFQYDLENLNNNFVQI